MERVKIHQGMRPLELEGFNSNLEGHQEFREVLGLDLRAMWRSVRTRSLGSCSHGCVWKHD